MRIARHAVNRPWTFMGIRMGINMGICLGICMAIANPAVAQPVQNQAAVQDQPAVRNQAPTQEQPDALGLLKKVAKTYHSMTSFRGEANLVTEMKGPHMQQEMEFAVTLTLGSQGRMRMETKGAEGVPLGGMLMIFDGNNMWMYVPQLNKYSKIAMGKTIASRPKGPGFGLGDLHSQFEHVADNVRQARVLRRETLQVNGRDIPCWVVSAEYESAPASSQPSPLGGAAPAGAGSRSSTLWVDAAHFLVYQEISESTMMLPGSGSPTETKQSLTFSQVTVDGPIPTDAFVFTPPEGATEMDLSSFMPQSGSPN